MTEIRDTEADADADDWLDALAGRLRADADPAVNAEALLLRQATRRWPVAVPAMGADEAQARRAALLAQARRDPRLAARRACAVCERLRRWLAQPLVSGAAALAMVTFAVVLVAPWRDETPPPTDTLRSPPQEGVQRLRAVDPRQLRDRIADELARAGIASTRYERLTRFGLDAELPLPLPNDVAKLLAGHGLVPPPSGGLAVEVEAAP